MNTDKRFTIFVYNEYISFCDENAQEQYKLYTDGTIYDVQNSEDIPQVLFKVKDFAQRMEKNEDYDMLARENKAMANALSKLGHTNAQISDIANGAI